MASPVDFEQKNGVLDAPKDMEEQVQPLEVFRFNNQVVSCWQFSPEEMEELVRNGGRVFVNVWSGRTQPPIYIWAGPLARGLM